MALNRMGDRSGQPKLSKATGRPKVPRDDGPAGPNDDVGAGDRKARGGSGGFGSRKARDRNDDRRDGDRERPKPEGGTAAQAQELAVYYLSQAPRSRKELADRLAEKGYGGEETEQALDRLAELGYVDDALFAEQVVRSRAGRQSAQVIGQALRAAGVDRETADDALAAGIDPDSELDTARALVARKIASTRGLPAQKRTTRLVGLLARRGYGGIAYDVVREALAADAEETAGDD